MKLNIFRNILKAFLFPLIFTSLVSSCGSDQGALETQMQIVKTQTSSNLNLLLKNLNKLTVEVIYEAGADPYVGNNFRNRPYWSVFETNIKAIYEQRNLNVEVVVPSELSEMTLIEIQDKDSWTADEISALIEKHKKLSPTATNGVVYALFVKGYFKNSDGIQPGVIGINITGTTIITIFKDVVENMGQTKDDLVAKFSEQSTFVHEFGHAIGLVNNGVSQVSEHHDSAHGSHCSDPDCVMYWLNEGASEMYSYVQKYMTSGSEVMYGEKCLEDIKNY